LKPKQKASSEIMNEKVGGKHTEAVLAQVHRKIGFRVDPDELRRLNSRIVELIQVHIANREGRREFREDPVPRNGEDGRKIHTIHSPPSTELRSVEKPRYRERRAGRTKTWK